MTSSNAICRIGVFYDGSLFTYAQHYYYHERDLMHAGVEPRYLPMSQTQGEKGIDVALAVDALQVGLDGKIDIAVLVTGDGDFVPLVRALNKQGVRVLGACCKFQTKDGSRPSSRCCGRARPSCGHYSLQNSRDSRDSSGHQIKKFVPGSGRAQEPGFPRVPAERRARERQLRERNGI